MVSQKVAVCWAKKINLAGTAECIYAEKRPSQPNSGQVKTIRMKKLNNRTSMFAISTFLLSAVASSLALSGEHKLHADIIMKKNVDGILACGMGFKLTSTNGSYAVNLVNEKVKSGMVTKLIVRSDQKNTISSAAVRTLDFSTQKILTKMQSDNQNTIYSQKLSPDTIGRLFQQLMVSGAKIEITSMSETITWDFPGPASQSLRAMYLMCSGDMYRP